MSRESGGARERCYPQELTALECRAVHLWRRMGFGTVTLTIQAGQPVQADGLVSLRLDRPEYPGAVDLLSAAVSQ
mgnify:FL=1